MADRGDTHYKTATLNKWFAGASVFLLLASFWMVLDDAMRPWKQYQREFRSIEIERSNEALATSSAQAALEDEARLTEVLATRQAELAARSEELSTAREELFLLEGEQFTTSEAEKVAKQVFNFAKFKVEEHRVHTGDDTYHAEEITELESTWAAANNLKLDIDQRVVTQRDLIASLNADVKGAEGDIKAATRGIDLVRTKLASLDPQDAPTIIANILRDFPGLDFIGPNLKVNKVVLPNLPFNLNFTTKPRIDMCHTCHVAIDSNGYEDLGQPFTNHPNLDLYLTATSPHPMTEMGCTICHRGAGEALDFIRADHRPTDETEGDEWNDEQHWHKQHHWDYPMLSSEMVEASCVQCHQDTMELIAEDAPEVTEGYRLFERYGCYSCHKVDWYPTKRRPGPSLTGIRQKAEREFIDAWVAKPKAFRPTTWMPQVFHLSNYSPETVIATSEYGQGRQIMGDEWSDSAIAAVSEFIWNRADDLASPAIPVEGDALRGQEVFQLVGCLACHNMAPFGEEERADIQASVEALSYSDYDLGEIANESNEHGPNLRGVATKVSREWLFAWIKDPSGYWSETRMPNLRLSDQEAADIVAYIFADPKGVFTETPEGWVTGKTPYKRDVLEEQARWFFNRELPAELDRRFAEEWADDTVLLEALGEKFVLAQGCHSCHEINGLENEQPIGTELSTWGSKTVDKLDWGLMHEFIAEERGLEGNHAWHFKQQLRSYREPWLDLKLENPRVFDREKFKNPTERLRMPYFGFDEAQRLALATFVVGLVEDEVSRARMVPSAAQQSMDTGLRAIRQNNCAACHVIEPGTIDFTDSDGAHRSVQGQYLAFEGEAMPPSNVDIHGAIANYEAFIQEVDEDPEFKVEDIAIQLLRPEPGVGEAGSLIVLEDIESLSSTPAWGGDFVNLVAKHYLYAFGYDENDEEISLTGDPDREGRVQDADGEWRYYGEEPFDKIRWTFAPPVLVDEGVKLQRDWFFDFLVSPYPLRQQLRVRMPTFTWNEGEAGAVADYFAQTASQDWPARYARKLLLEQGIDPAVENDSADKGLVAFLNTVASGGHGSISPSQLRGILMGDKVSTAAQFAKLKSYGDAIGFSTYGANDPAYESIAVNQPATIDAILAAMPDYLNRVHRLSADGPNCFQCHFLQGTPPVAEGPIAWAPDLDNTRSRLRPDWVREWLTDPLKIYPGTAMPANFPLDAAQWQDIWEAPSEEQIEAVTTWLFNLDRWAIRN